MVSLTSVEGFRVFASGGIVSQRDSVPQPRVGAQRLPWVRVSHPSQPNGLPEGSRGSQRSEAPRSTSSNLSHPGGVPELYACVTKILLHPSGVRRSLVRSPGVSSRSALLNPRLPSGKPPACPDFWSRSDLLTVAVGFSPRTIERNRPRRVATFERPALTSTSRLAPRGTLTWASNPWAEAHGYRHILAPRGHRGTSRSLFS